MQQENTDNIEAKKQKIIDFAKKIRAEKTFKKQVIEVQRYMNKKKAKKPETEKKPQKRIDKHDAQVEMFCRQWIIDFNGNWHLLFSVGRDIKGPNILFSYFSIQFTI